MKEIIALFLMGTLLILSAGCGHNILTFSQGKYLNLGFDPGTNKLGVQYVNGEHITIVEKDNATLTVEMTDTLDADGKKTTNVSKITYEIKEQMTGGDVEALKIKSVQ